MGSLLMSGQEGCIMNCRISEHYTNLVLGIPHAVPTPAFGDWRTIPGAREEAERFTDWATDELFASDDPRVTAVKARLSRMDCDAERLEDEPDRLCKFVRHIGADGQFRVPAPVRNRCLAAWFSYRADLMCAAAQGDFPLIVDCHSFPSDLAPDVDICIGFNEDASKPAAATLELVAHIFRDAGYSVAFNRPYSNALAPVGYIGHSLMIEVNKHTYMNEQTREKSARFNQLQSTIRKVYHALLKTSKPLTNDKVGLTTAFSLSA